MYAGLAGCTGLLPAPVAEKRSTIAPDLARATKGIRPFNTHLFLVMLVIGHYPCDGCSKQTLTVVCEHQNCAVLQLLGGIGDAMFWANATLRFVADRCVSRHSILGAVVFTLCSTWCTLGCGFGLARIMLIAGVAAIPPIKANTKKKSASAASIVGMTVIGALVATCVRLSTTLKSPRATQVKLQADVIDKLMPASYRWLVYT